MDGKGALGGGVSGTEAKETVVAKRVCHPGTGLNCVCNAQVGSLIEHTPLLLDTQLCCGRVSLSAVELTHID